jgi:hypothetical protein
VLSPRTNPGENFVQGVQSKMDLQIAISQFLDPLGTVPGSLAHQLGGERVKLQGYFVCFTVFTLPDLEAVLEKLLQNLRGRFLKQTRRSFDLTHPGENEYAPGVALEVVG